MIASKLKWTGFLAICGLLAGCSAAIDADSLEHEPSPRHSEVADFQPAPAGMGKDDGVSATFDPDFIVSDTVFRATDGLDVLQIQAFLEDPPYGEPSWLATEMIGEQPASAMIADVSRRHGLNPLIMLVWLQWASSSISKTSRPDDYTINRLLECGCFNGPECADAYQGFEKQLDCAATEFDAGFEHSVNETGGTARWHRGRTKKTFDGAEVTPANHATAAVYGATPWLEPERGGAWLFWNVLMNYSAHLDAENLDEPSSSADESR